LKLPNQRKLFTNISLYSKRLASLAVKPRRQAVYVEACLWTLVAFCIRLFFPFNKAIHAMGMQAISGKDLSVVPINLGEMKNSRHWREIGAAYDNVSALVSPSRPCLLSAYAVRFHLGVRSIPFILCLGVAHNSNNNLSAHAWTIVDDTVVTGMRGWRDEFVRVAGYRSA